MCYCVTVGIAIEVIAIVGFRASSEFCCFSQTDFYITFLNNFWTQFWTHMQIQTQLHYFVVVAVSLIECYLRMLDEKHHK